MSELLEPNEVDALLAAVRSGNVRTSGEVKTADGEDVTPYNFEHPERLSREQLRSLLTLCEGFARVTSSALSELMRADVEVSYSTVEQSSGASFVARFHDPTALATATNPSLPTKFVLEMSPGFVYSALDRMLGGSQKTVEMPDRQLTEIELRLFSKLAGRVLDALSDAWHDVVGEPFKVGEVLTSPQRLRDIGDHEAMLAAMFDMTLGDHHGLMTLCMSCAAVEPLLDCLVAGAVTGKVKGKPDDADVVRVSRALGAAELEMVAYLAETTITVRELLELQVGDVIKTDLPTDGEITLCVDGKPRFKGTPGRIRRNKGVHVTRRISSEQQD